jgi:hypothetical protein
MKTLFSMAAAGRMARWAGAALMFAGLGFAAAPAQAQTLTNSPWVGCDITRVAVYRSDNGKDGYEQFGNRMGTTFYHAGFDNQITSLCLPPGARVDLFPERTPTNDVLVFDNRRGDNFMLIENLQHYRRDLPGDINWNDTVSSLQITGDTIRPSAYRSCDTNGVGLYEHGWGQGFAIYQPVSIPYHMFNLHSSTNDRITTVCVPPMTKVTLYEHGNASGRSRVYANTHAYNFQYVWLDSGMNDKTTSVVVETILAQ